MRHKHADELREPEYVWTPTAEDMKWGESRRVTIWGVDVNKTVNRHIKVIGHGWPSTEDAREALRALASWGYTSAAALLAAQYRIGDPVVFTPNCNGATPFWYHVVYGPAHFRDDGTLGIPIANIGRDVKPVVRVVRPELIHLASVQEAADAAGYWVSRYEVDNEPRYRVGCRHEPNMGDTMSVRGAWVRAWRECIQLRYGVDGASWVGARIMTGPPDAPIPVMQDERHTSDNGVYDTERYALRTLVNDSRIDEMFDAKMVERVRS